MPTRKFYSHCPLFYGFKGTVFDLEGEDRKVDYLTLLCRNWTDLPYPVMQEYFKNHELVYDWDEYKRLLYPEIIKAVGDLIYEQTEIRIDMKSVREEIFYIQAAKGWYEQTRIYMEVQMDPEEVIAYIKQDWNSFVKFLPCRNANVTEKWLDPSFWDSPKAVGLVLEFLATHNAKSPGEYVTSRVLDNVDPKEYTTTPEDFTSYIEDVGAFEFRAEYDRLMLQGDRYLEIMKKQQPRKWTKYKKQVADGKDRVLRELAEELAEKIAEYAPLTMRRL